MCTYICIKYLMGRAMKDAKACLLHKNRDVQHKYSMHIALKGGRACLLHKNRDVQHNLYLARIQSKDKGGGERERERVRERDIYIERGRERDRIYRYTEGERGVGENQRADLKKSVGRVGRWIYICHHKTGVQTYRPTLSSLLPAALLRCVIHFQMPTHLYNHTFHYCPPCHN